MGDQIHGLFAHNSGHNRPDLAWTTAYWRILETLLGTLVVTLVSGLFFKNRAAAQLERTLEGVAASEAQLFRLVVRRMLGEVGLERELAERVGALESQMQGVRSLKAGLTMAPQLRGLDPKRLYEEIFVRVRHLVALTSDLGDVRREGLCDPLLRELVDSVALIIASAADVPLQEIEEGRRRLKEVRAHYETIRHERHQRHLPFDEVVAIHSLLETCEGVIELVGEVQTATEAQRRADEIGLERREGGLGAWDRFALLQATRLGVSCVLAMVVWLLSDWYGARVGLVSAMVVGMEHTTHNSVRKGWQRILGNLAGAALGLFLLSFAVQDIISLMVALAVGAGLFAYIQAGSARYNYIGVRGGLAISMVLVVSDQQSTLMSPSMERVAGRADA